MNITASEHHTKKLTKTERRKLWKAFVAPAHRGTIAQIAANLGIGSNSISQWFKGTTESARIEAAVIERAKELGFIDDTQAA